MTSFDRLAWDKCMLSSVCVNTVFYILYVLICLINVFLESYLLFRPNLRDFKRFKICFARLVVVEKEDDCMRVFEINKKYPSYWPIWLQIYPFFVYRMLMLRFPFSANGDLKIHVFANNVFNFLDYEW